MKLILSVMLALLSFWSFSASAAAPTCHDHSGGPYCSYTGSVAKVYVNNSSLVLMYFDEGFDLSIATSRGFNVANNFAGAIRIDDNPAFADYFYSTALAAQASGRDVSIQMRGNIGGYLRIDRIWLAE